MFPVSPGAGGPGGRTLIPLPHRWLRARALVGCLGWPQDCVQPAGNRCPINYATHAVSKESRSGDA
jgi:hypothetical protein